MTLTLTGRLVVTSLDPPSVVEGDLVACEVVVRDHRLTKVDQDELAVKVAVGTSRLWERLEAVDAHPFSPRGG